MTNGELADTQEWATVVFDSREHDVAVVKYVDSRDQKRGAVFYGDKRMVPFGITNIAACDKLLFDTALETALSDGASVAAIEVIKQHYETFYTSMME